MTLPKIRVNLEQRTFSIDDTEVKLEDNFVGAELSKVEGVPKEAVLELIYSIKKDFDSTNDSEKIHLLAQNKGYKQIDVNNFLMEEFPTKPCFPAVVVYGEMNATLSNR